MYKQITKRKLIKVIKNHWAVENWDYASDNLIEKIWNEMSGVEKLRRRF